LIILGIILGVLLLSACGPPEPEPSSGLNLLALLQPSGAFRQPTVLDLNDPGLHGAHPEQRIDLWTATIWLQDTKGQDYSGQLAIVRFGLTSDEAVSERRSQWAAQELYSARFSLGDETQSWQAERIARAALGLAGAEAQGVWLEQWRLSLPRRDNPTVLLSVEFQDSRMLQLTGQTHAAPQALELAPGLPASPLGYVLPPIAVEGRLMIADESRPVSGQIWLDHVWGNGLPLGRGQLGLLQLRISLDNGLRLHCLQLRRRDGSGTPIGGCNVFGPLSNNTQVLDRRALQLQPQQDLMQWTLDSEHAALSLRIRATDMAGGGFAGSAHSAVVEGTYQANTVRGRAWLELSGFAITPDS